MELNQLLSLLVFGALVYYGRGTIVNQMRHLEVTTGKQKNIMGIIAGVFSFFMRLSLEFVTWVSIVVIVLFGLYVIDMLASFL